MEKVKNENPEIIADVDNKGKIGKTITTAMLALCILSLAVTGGVWHKACLFGFKPFYIMSASMDPTIKTGQIVLGRMTDIDHVDVGDIVAYRTDSGKTIIHRIISKNQDNTVEFRGDNNPDQISTDKAVAADQILYKIILY